MHGLDNMILDLTVILAAAAIATVLFKKLKQPVVLGYIVVGIIISPNFLYFPSILSADDIKVWADIGIIFLMFALGLEFSFHKIAKVGGSAIVTASVVMSAMIAIGYGVGMAMGLGVMNSIFLGGMMSMSSTMIILKAYDELELKSKGFAQIVLGVLVIEDIAGIFMMIVLSTVSASKNFSGLELAGEIIVLLLALIVILCIGIYFVPTILKRIKSLMNNEILLVVSLGFCLIMVVIAVKIGFSEALGAFLAGSILAGTTFAERIEEMILPIRDLFGAIFFVSVGMMVNLPSLPGFIVPILIITVVTIVGQMTFSATGAFLSGQSLHTSVRVGFSMVQVGEFSFILAALGSSLGVMSDDLYQIIVFVSVITTFFTPMFINNGERAYLKINALLPKKWKMGMRLYTREKRRNSFIDEDWRAYLKKYILKLVLCAAALFIIAMVGTQYIMPYLLRRTPDLASVQTVVLICLMGALAPFINILCRKRNVLFSKLWIKNSTNKFPLIGIQVFNLLISTIAVMFVINQVLNRDNIILEVILSVVIVVIYVKSSFIRGRALDLEARFIANFNQKVLSHKKQSVDGHGKLPHVMDELYAIEFEVITSDETRTVSDLIASRAFGVTFIQIRRADGVYVNVIKAGTPIRKGDVITAVGTPERIDAYVTQLEQKGYNIEDIQRNTTLTEYIYSQIFNKVASENQLVCLEIPITKESSLYKKPIKDNEFRTKFKGSIIGIEREHLPIFNPNPNFILYEGDLIWVLGTQVMVDEIMNAKRKKIEGNSRNIITANGIEDRHRGKDVNELIKERKNL